MVLGPGGSIGTGAGVWGLHWCWGQCRDWGLGAALVLVLGGHCRSLSLQVAVPRTTDAPRQTLVPAQGRDPVTGKCWGWGLCWGGWGGTHKPAG